MQHLDDGQWVTEGCFVYQVIFEGGLQTRSTLNVGDESCCAGSYEKGDLVSVDQIRPSRNPGSQNGPFLRLSDGSGWLFERKYGERVMKPVTVESVRWKFYVDNYPIGLGLRHHPIDRQDTRIKRGKVVAYSPMQKICVDRHVVHPDTGVNFYRVQGTEGWVFDRRITGEKPDCYMLLDESQVKRGLFAYRSLACIAVRSKPVVGDDCRTLRTVYKGETIVADVIRKSPYRHGNGPFLRLADGSGWLFENKRSEKVMEEIPIQIGSWTLRVLNHPLGIALRRQPIDDASRQNQSSLHFQVSTYFNAGSLITCDRKIESFPENGANFYRVKDHNGWVFDKRGERPILELFSTNADHIGWDVNFVRRIASNIGGVEEIYFNPLSCVVSFRTVDSTRVNVYYTTRTIGTAMDHPAQGRIQMFRRNCSMEDLQHILTNPRVHTGKGYYRRSAGSRPPVIETPEGPGIILDMEEEEREELELVEKEMSELAAKRLAILKRVKKYDDKEAVASLSRMKTAALRDSEEKKERDKRCQKAAEEEEQEREKRRRQEAEDEVQRRNANWTCRVCYRTFQSRHSLHQHRNALGH